MIGRRPGIAPAAAIPGRGVAPAAAPGRGKVNPAALKGIIQKLAQAAKRKPKRGRKAKRATRKA